MSQLFKITDINDNLIQPSNLFKPGTFHKVIPLILRKLNEKITIERCTKECWPTESHWKKYFCLQLFSLHYTFFPRFQTDKVELN